MRVKTAKYNPGNIGSQEGPMDITFSGPLFLHADPVQEKHAVTKQYVDARFGNLDAGDLKTDVLPTSILPAFDGDVNSSQGSNVFTLSNTGVTPGTYTKVTVDLKGRVVSGGSLTNEDIPNLSWSKMVRDKPTTLTGYGITDAVPMSGGTVGSAVKLNGLPSDELHVSNRQYLDNKVEALGSTASPGTVFRFSSDKTPEGFLRCSGGELDKLDYSNLYSVIGEKYSLVVDYSLTSGKPWKQQNKTNTSNTVPSGWVTSAPLPIPLCMSQVLVTKNRVYLLGGTSGTGIMSAVYTAPINEDGTIGNWVTGTPLPIPLTMSQVLVTKNRVYLLGGTSGTGIMSAVYTAPINEDGTIGNWVTGTPLLSPLSTSQVLVTKNRVYLLGGTNGSGSLAVTYTAPIKTDGTIGAWETSTSLPGNISYSQVVTIGEKVYLLGGYNSATFLSVIYTASINKDGTLTPWSIYGNLPITLFGAQVVVISNKIFIIGGANTGAILVKSVYSAPILEGGLLGSFSLEENLPMAICYSQVCVLKNKLHLFGGYINGVPVNNTCNSLMDGGSSDYSQYYNGQHWVLNNPAKFKLPDHTHLEDQNTYYYIRY